ncbi:MAG: AraC family transcriptional regulator [Bdellovibrionota bacterium]|nr:AraC family transcriptional regulator [Bdellovibrionota bacterium]
MDYLNQLNRAIDYIEKHLDEKLIIQDIAKEAGISQWHFQRVFRGATGESIKSYVNARKLSKAAEELASSKTKILDIAVKYNYSSHEAFTRAFQKYFRMSPKEFRQYPNLKRLGNIMFRPHITEKYLEHLYEGMNMKPEIKELEAMEAYGLSSIMYSTNDPLFQENFKNIPNLWQRLRKEIHDIKQDNLKRMAFIFSTEESKIDSPLKYYAAFEATEDLVHLNL